MPDRTFSRLTGNRLRELDRFLSVLLDEVAGSWGAAGHDGRSFARWRNTPRKLGHVHAMMGMDRAGVTRDEARLRAIGRISACLHHCAGTIHAPGLHRDLLLAQGREAAAAFASPPPGLLRLSPDAIGAIGRFYRALGDALVAGLPQRADIDFQSESAHMGTANVACDGI